jgi:hypothetical protein
MMNQGFDPVVRQPERALLDRLGNLRVDALAVAPEQRAVDHLLDQTVTEGKRLSQAKRQGDQEMPSFQLGHVRDTDFLAQATELSEQFEREHRP